MISQASFPHDSTPFNEKRHVDPFITSVRVHTLTARRDRFPEVSICAFLFFGIHAFRTFQNALRSCSQPLTATVVASQSPRFSRSNQNTLPTPPNVLCMQFLKPRLPKKLATRFERLSPLQNRSQDIAGRFSPVCHLT